MAELAKKVRLIEIDENVYQVLNRMKKRYNQPMKRLAEVMICDTVDMATLHEYLTGPHFAIGRIKNRGLRHIK